MRINICGIEEVNYTSRKTGKEVNGQKVYFTYEEDNVHGYACDTAFIKGDKQLKPKTELPAYAELYYNKYGGIEEIYLT